MSTEHRALHPQMYEAAKIRTRLGYAPPRSWYTQPLSFLTDELRADIMRQLYCSSPLIERMLKS